MLLNRRENRSMDTANAENLKLLKKTIKRKDGFWP